MSQQSSLSTNIRAPLAGMAPGLVGILLLLASGCGAFSSIKQADCKIEKVSGSHPDSRKPGEVTSMIFDTRTGEMYEYDEFPEELERINGVTEVDGFRHQTESLMVGKRWKMRMKTDEPGRADPPSVWTFEMDLPSMKFKESEESGISFASATYEGTCAWVKPKTTKVKQS